MMKWRNYYFKKDFLTHIPVYTQYKYVSIYVYTHTMFYFLSKMKNVHHLRTFNMRLEFLKQFLLVFNLSWV